MVGLAVVGLISWHGMTSGRTGFMAHGKIIISGEIDGMSSCSTSGRTGGMAQGRYTILAVRLVACSRYIASR